MNRVILVLNVTILVVNFALAFSATDSQLGILRSTSGIANRAAWRGTDPHRADSLAYLRIVNSIEGIVPRDQPLTHEQLQAVHQALDRYRRSIDAGVARVLYEEAGMDQIHRSLARLNKDAREEIEISLGAAFKDSALASRLATEIIRNAG